MPEQLFLPGFDAGSQPTDRLFFAIYPDPPAAARIARVARNLRDEHGLKGKPLPTKRFHVTLHFLGDYAGLPPDVVAMASAAAATVSMPSFDLAFDRTMSFTGRPGNRPFVLVGGEGVAAVAAFQQALGAALEKTGLGGRVESRYTPHVTLLYNPQLVAGQAVEPIAWTAREFVLVRSLIGRTRHVPLARWSLAEVEPRLTMQ